MYSLLLYKKVVQLKNTSSSLLHNNILQLNPQKEIPVLDDNGFLLSESVAIMQYLCDKYRPESSLYPKDPVQRALVNQRLCFNLAFYYNYISQYAVKLCTSQRHFRIHIHLSNPFLYNQLAPIFFDYPRTPHGLQKVHYALSTFETYLKRGGTKYAAGKTITLADLGLVTATACVEVIDVALLDGYPLIKEWYTTFRREYPALWSIMAGGLAELIAFEKQKPDLSHMNHPLHPVRKQRVKSMFLYVLDQNGSHTGNNFSVILASI